MDPGMDDSGIKVVKKPKSSKKERKKYKQIRPKVSTDWAHHDVIKLIHAVAERPSLWDASSEQYKTPKPPAWREVADIIGEVTADECKAKWSNLRVTYSVNKRKEQQYPYRGPIIWRYFNAMKFLNVNETSQTSESISSITQFSEESNSLATEPEQPKPCLQKSVKKVNESEPPKPCLQESVEKDEPVSSPLMLPNTDIFKEMIEKAICAIDERTREKDQFDAFGDHVAAELRSLPETKALLAKRKLARALVDIMDEVQSKVLT